MTTPKTDAMTDVEGLRGLADKAVKPSAYYLDQIEGGGACINFTGEGNEAIKIVCFSDSDVDFYLDLTPPKIMELLLGVPDGGPKGSPVSFWPVLLPVWFALFRQQAGMGGISTPFQKEPSMNTLTPFYFQSKEVRSLTDATGYPWFIAADVCDILDIKNPTQAVNQLDEDERSMQNIGRQGEAHIISESGLYTLIIRSNKPEAKVFRKWITSEVLPSLRKTGHYTIGNNGPCFGNARRGDSRIAPPAEIEETDLLFAAFVKNVTRLRDDLSEIAGMTHATMPKSLLVNVINALHQAGVCKDLSATLQKSLKR